MAELEPSHITAAVPGSALAPARLTWVSPRHQTSTAQSLEHFTCRNCLVHRWACLVRSWQTVSSQWLLLPWGNRGASPPPLSPAPSSSLSHKELPADWLGQSLLLKVGAQLTKLRPSHRTPGLAAATLFRGPAQLVPGDHSRRVDGGFGFPLTHWVPGEGLWHKVTVETPQLQPLSPAACVT